MDAIEKRARELLAAEYETDGRKLWADQIRAGNVSRVQQRAINATRAALTPPEGYVLVLVDSVKSCACGCGRYCCTHCGTELGCYKPASPEVP